jgi:hypothetical protein
MEWTAVAKGRTKKIREVRNKAPGFFFFTYKVVVIIALQDRK